MGRVVNKVFDEQISWTLLRWGVLQWSDIVV